jgi:hypothetical protein
VIAKEGSSNGASLAGTFWIEKDSIPGLLLGPRGHSDFKSGGHLELW